MKRLFIILIFIGSVLITWAYDFSAVTPTGQTLYYNISGSTVSVTYPGRQDRIWVDYIKPTGSLTIPSYVSHSGSTYSVTSIGSSAFYECDGLTSVIIPTSVTTIGSSAFYGCSGLCSVSIPNTVTSIGSSAFYGCSGLTSVTIPNSVTTISSYAFGNCSGLTTVTIPNTVTTIGSNAFLGCSGLTSVTIPNSVTSIDNTAFNNCNGLVSVDVDVNNAHYDSRDNCNAIIETGSNTLILGCQNTFIPNTVTTIGNYAFSFCYSLTSVIIPNSVTSIGRAAFYYCRSLTSITIPASVTTIGINAFSYCSDLTSVICSASTAPAISSSSPTFYNVPSSATIYIPCGSTTSYLSTWGAYFSNFIEHPSYNITVSSADPTQGFVVVTAQPTCANSVVEVTATPLANYHFDYWNDGITDNPRTINLTQDTVVIAYFSLGPTQCDTIVIHDTTYVDRWHHDTTYVDRWHHDTTYVDRWHHDTTYVDRWHHDTTYVDRWHHDTTYIDRYIHDTLFHDIDNRTISVISGNVSRGLVAGNGNFPIGSQVEIAAIPIVGNHFVQWQDGNTSNPRTVILTDNLFFVATFDGTECVDNTLPADYTISTQGNQVVVTGTANRRVRIFDSVGHLLSTSLTSNSTTMFTVPATGVYLIQIAHHPAQKVVLR